jgi:polysaccharide pyruvyl transferase WcaK-like protein/sulfatase maturation enzyme AslB (radical SAM superfamily)
VELRKHLKTISYLFKDRPYALEKPAVLQFPVIDICNSRCQMCRIWENKKSDDITPDALRMALRNPLYSQVVSVGLNGGEPTLRKDLSLLAAVLFEELPELKNISLITNAYNCQEVITRITEVGEVVARHNGKLDVMVSLDGIGEMHDLVRGKPGNFERAQNVIDFVIQSSLVSTVRIGCTIIKTNVYGLAALLEFCQGKGVYVKYRLGIPHQRLYTQDLVDPYALSDEEKYHVAEFLEGLITHYETNDRQKFFYRSLIDQLIHNVPRKAGCDWQHRGATITARGELLYCAVQSKALGNICRDDSHKIYFENQMHLQEIVKNKCASCHHDYMGLPPKRHLAEELALKALDKIRAKKALRWFLRDSAVGLWYKKHCYNSRLRSLKQHAETSAVINSTRGSIRILICGWYGTETLGDKAILAGIVQVLRGIFPHVEVTLASLHPYVSEMTRRQMPELQGLEIVSSRESIPLVGAMNLVLFGGGPVMALNELAEMEAIFYAAQRHGVPTIIAGCGVGPLGAGWHNESLSNILRMASLRIYRDEKSLIAASALGIDTRSDVVAEDPAFTWLMTQKHTFSKRLSSRRVLLLGLRDFPYSQYARDLGKSESLKIKNRYEQEVVHALKLLVSSHDGLTLRPLPMCTNHFGGDDRWFYRKLFREESSLMPALDLTLLDRELAPSEYTNAFLEADVVLAMRFHSLVFSIGLGVPAVAIDYTLGQGKVGALAERFKIPCQSIADIDAQFIQQELEQQLENPLAQAEGFSPVFGDQLRKLLPTIMQGLQPS